jgi:LmbE family N-acetylglucosaminyl deacetylase
MTINPLPDARKVLILAPHPDDESIGCGGTIALYSSKGIDVHLAVISSGENIALEYSKDIDIAAVRRRELEVSSQILGIKNVYFLGFPDGQLALNKEGIEEKLKEIIDKINPDIIFAPCPFEHHADHRAVSEAAISFLIKGCAFKVAFYSVYGTIRLNTLVDISNVMSIKERAVKSYYFSLFRQPDLFNESIKGFNRFWSFYVRRLGYYEAFWVVSSPLTHFEIYNWLTYGMDSAKSRSLSNLKTGDSLIFELNKSYNLLSCKETELKTKESELMEMYRTRQEDKERLAESNRQLEEMRSSLIWRIAGKYYSVRDSLLPKGSLIRNIYNRIMLFIKGG